MLWVCESLHTCFGSGQAGPAFPSLSDIPGVIWGSNLFLVDHPLFLFPLLLLSTERPACNFKLLLARVHYSRKNQWEKHQRGDLAHRLSLDLQTAGAPDNIRMNIKAVGLCMRDGGSEPAVHLQLTSLPAPRQAVHWVLSLVLWPVTAIFWCDR